MKEQFDLIVIGSGPGGYVAAIKAAKLGLDTLVIEEREVGGTCLNRGCIPAKAMIHASSLYKEIKDGERFGIFAKDVTYDYGKILSYKEEISEGLRKGVEQLFKANGVTLIKGKGTLGAEKKVTVVTQEGTQVLTANSVILASGSKPVIPPIEGIDLPGVLTSDELFQLEQVPTSLVIIGGGVISVEFAAVFASLGCKVTIVEALQRIVPNMDKDISQNLKMILKKRGMDIYTSAAVQHIKRAGEELTCTLIEKEKEIHIQAEYVLAAVGRCPNTEGLFDSNLTLDMERGRVVVDNDFQSSIAGVYAIGDLIMGPQLAHAASAQGIYVAEMLAGKEPSIDLHVVPGCVYTSPEIASVGLTEEEAKVQGIEVKVVKFIMSANSKSMITKEERGFIKMIIESSTDVILGTQMMCARATDMIGELGTAIANQLTTHQLLKAMRAHPTYNEGVGEALEEACGGAIHVAPRKKLI
ncbi:MAG: dihydrolipoyl dehydrogenase [Lachnospiraceae bacterium]